MTLAQYLAQKGITPSRFARLADVRASTICRIMNGERRPRIDTVTKICGATGGLVSLEDLAEIARSKSAVGGHPK